MMMMMKPDSQTPAPMSCRARSSDSAPAADAASTVSTAVFSPLHRRSLSAIPFSWEQHPGIAKPTVPKKSTEVPVKHVPKSILPRPPPMSLDSLSHVHIRCPKRTSNSAAFVTVDPFELALAECAKVPPTPPGLMEEIWGRKMVEPQRTRSWRFGLGVHSIYRCNAASACSIVDSKVHVPRAGLQTASCRILSHGRYM